MKEEYKEVNIEDVISRLHVNEEMVQRLIKMTFNSDIVDQAQQAFASGNLEDAERTIHTVKGTAANVGLVGISKLALEIELKIKENSYLDLELLNVLSEVWNELKNQYI